MFSWLRTVLTDKALALRIAVQALLALSLTLLAVWAVARYLKPEGDGAVKVVASVAAAVASLLSGAKTLADLSSRNKEIKQVRETLNTAEQEVKTKQSELQEKEAEVRSKEAELQKHKATERRAELTRRERAAETYSAIEGKCNSAPKLSDIVWNKEFIDLIRWSDEVAERVAKNAAAAEELGVGAKLVVVASGKGGVGKSTLALGLTEAFSRVEKTLLVDFDLHNRGLTSLLHSTSNRVDGRTAKAPTNVLAEFDRFDSLFEAAHLLGPQASPSAGGHEKDLLTRFTELRDSFGKAGRPLPHGAFAGKAYLRPGELLSVIPERTGFLPSTSPAPNVRFLASATFRAQFLEVYFFLKCLCYWAGNLPNQFGVVVLDCHGAHDHFMIGAIHAAAALLVVTTPEPGGFDGTYDLLAFAEVLRKETPSGSGNFPTVLAINNCLDWQQDSVDAIVKFVKDKTALSFITALAIANENEIRSITNNYEFGDSARADTLWKASTNIQECFSQFWNGSIAQPEKIQVEGSTGPDSVTV
jgi:MinD-like ATPase involved in chromosome partitioning or flagellar assembly/DNA-binding protein H-NS